MSDLKMSDAFGKGLVSSYHEVVCKVGEDDICFLDTAKKRNM